MDELEEVESSSFLWQTFFAAFDDFLTGGLRVQEELKEQEAQALEEDQDKALGDERSAVESVQALLDFPVAAANSQLRLAHLLFEV